MLNTELLPAQVLFLQNPKKIKVHEVFAIIFRDLVVRKVLQVSKMNSFPNDRSRKTQKYVMLYKGEAYEGYEPANFEKNLLAPFSDIDAIQIKTLTNFILRKYSMPSSFVKTQFMNKLSKEGYINSTPILKSFGVFGPSSKGKEIINEFNQLINIYEEKLNSLIDGNKEEFYNVVKEMGSYIFAFEHRNPDLYKNIESMIRRIFKNLSLGPEKDLNEYFQGMAIDLSYLHE